MYGLRQSPRSWGLYRDKVLRDMRSPQGHRFVQAEAEPNLWSIVMNKSDEDENQEGRMLGFLLVYVDDLMITSSEETI